MQKRYWFQFPFFLFLMLPFFLMLQNQLEECYYFELLELELKFENEQIFLGILLVISALMAYLHDAALKEFLDVMKVFGDVEIFVQLMDFAFLLVVLLLVENLGKDLHSFHLAHF